MKIKINGLKDSQNEKEMLSSFAGQSGNAVRDKDKRNSKVLNKYFFPKLNGIVILFIFHLDNEAVYTGH